MWGSDSRVFYFTTNFRTELHFLAKPVMVAEGKWTHSLMSTSEAIEKKYRSNFGEVDVAPAKNDKVNKMEK